MRSSVVMLRRGWAVALAAAALAAAAPPAAAQSLLANRGLGLVVEPSDARARGLGGVRLGLADDLLSWSNPAEAVGIPAPGFKVVYQFDDFRADYAGQTVDGSTARFPLILGGFALSDRWAVTAGVGGFLDQNWAVERVDSLLIGPDTVAVLDRVSSEGAVVRARIGTGYRLLDGLSLGVGADFFLGGVEQFRGRSFPTQGEPDCCRAQWTYSGIGAVAGVDWQPNEAVRVGASVTSGGALRARSDDSLAVNREYDLPATVAAGASGRVAGELLLALSADWAGWSSLDQALTEVGGARDTWSMMGGAEYDGLRVADRPVPLRLGGRYAALPFRWNDAGAEQGWAAERAITSGLGVVLASGATRADLAVERGWRGGEAAGLEESYWRTVLSVTVLGR